MPRTAASPWTSPFAHLSLRRIVAACSLLAALGVVTFAATEGHAGAAAPLPAGVRQVLVTH